MIARLWRGVSSRENADEFWTYVLNTGVRDFRAAPGNGGVEVLRRFDGETAEFLFLSFWESMDDIRRLVGPDVDRASSYPEDARLLLQFDATVRHFDVEQFPASHEASGKMGAWIRGEEP